LTAQVREKAEGRVGKDIAVATEVAKLQTFNGTSSKVSRFLSACKLYIRIRIRESLVEE